MEGKEDKIFCSGDVFRTCPALWKCFSQCRKVGLLFHTFLSSGFISFFATYVYVYNPKNDDSTFRSVQIVSRALGWWSDVSWISAGSTIPRSFQTGCLQSNKKKNRFLVWCFTANGHCQQECERNACVLFGKIGSEADVNGMTARAFGYSLNQQNNEWLAKEKSAGLLICTGICGQWIWLNANTRD